MENQSKVSYLDSIMPIVIICLSTIILQFIISGIMEIYKYGTIAGFIDGQFMNGHFITFIGIILLLSILLRIFTKKIFIFLYLAGIISLCCQYELLDISAESAQVGAPIPLGIIEFFIILPLVFVLIVFCYLALRVVFTNYPKVKKFAYILTAIMFIGIILGLTIEADSIMLSADKITIYEIIGIVVGSIPLIAIIISAILLAIIIILSFVYISSQVVKFQKGKVTNITIPQDVNDMLMTSIAMKIKNLN